MVNEKMAADTPSFYFLFISSLFNLVENGSQ